MYIVQYTKTDLVQSIRCLNSLTSRLCIVQDPQACTNCSYFFHTAREHMPSWSLAKFSYEYGNLSKVDQCAHFGLAVQRYCTKYMYTKAVCVGARKEIQSTCWRPTHGRATCGVETAWPTMEKKNMTQHKLRSKNCCIYFQNLQNLYYFIVILNVGKLNVGTSKVNLVKSEI